MKYLLRHILAAWLTLCCLNAAADARVYSLVTPQPEQIVEALRSLYGDKIRADLVQQRLVVMGSAEQLREIDTLLAQLDRPPAALRFTLREQPPAAATDNAVTYSSGDRGGLSIDTVESAPVVLEYSQISQRPVGHGWRVSIDDVPTEVTSIMLQAKLQRNNTVQVLLSFSREENQRRRVIGKTTIGELGDWLAILPEPETSVTVSAADERGDKVFSSGPKRGSQLYLRVERIDVVGTGPAQR